jgi:hypothetical protein
MTAARTAVGKALAKFRVAKVMTMAELTRWLNCSVRTARRRLKSWGAIRSYNGNGGFYTLREVARFDANGLWSCREARFSRHGNLTETVVALVCGSRAGLTASELGDMLCLNTHSFISRFASHPQIARRCIAGRYVYFASDCGLRRKQRQARCALQRGPVATLPSDAEAVLIFAEMIRHPDLEPEEISQRLAAEGVEVDALRIRQLLRHHALIKKGAPDSGLFAP